jgi:hypothetical protein
MIELLDRVRKVGWLLAEGGLLIVILSILLNIILGPESGVFVSAVAANANLFLLGLPAGVLLSLALVVLAYALAKSGMRR